MVRAVTVDEKTAMTGGTRFSGIKAVVTGGASGIGAATVRLLLDGGARVASLDIASSTPGTGSIDLRADVSDPDVSTVLIDAVERLGVLDVLVNNAGVGAVGTIESSDDDVFRRLFDINVLGIVRVTRAAMPYLRESSHASVVNTCSVSAQLGLPGRAAYSASKGAVLALTMAMATDYLADEIRVSCVAPGTVNSPWVGRLLEAADDPEQMLAALEARQPTGRMVSPEEVAAAICFLASPEAGSITGTVLNVDGGWKTLRPAPS